MEYGLLRKRLLPVQRDQNIVLTPLTVGHGEMWNALPSFRLSVFKKDDLESFIRASDGFRYCDGYKHN